MAAVRLMSGAGLLHLRMSSRVAVALLLLFLLVGAVLPGTATASPSSSASPGNLGLTGGFGWPTFHGEQNRSGVSPYPGPTTATPRWFACPLGGTGPPINVGPVENATRVWVADVSGDLWSFDLANGTVVWSDKVNGGPTTAQLIPPDLILGDSTGELWSVNAATGRLVWSTNVGGGIVQGVATDGANLYFTTTTGAVEARNATTGTPVWSRLLGTATAGAVALDGNRLYASTANGTVAALTTANALLWIRYLHTYTTTGPAVWGGRVVVTDAGANVTTLFASNGSTAWRTLGSGVGTRGATLSTPAVFSTGVYVSLIESGATGEVAALNFTTGALRWSTSFVSIGTPAVSSPALAVGGLYLITADGEFTDLNPATGTVIFQSILGQVASYSSPALLPGEADVGDTSGCVYDLYTASTALPWPVTGTVTSTNGNPIAGATVTTSGAATVTRPNGSFTLYLANGTYTVAADALGFAPGSVSVTVAGPTSGVVLRLAPLVYFSVEGVVRNAWSLAPLDGASVTFLGPEGTSGFEVTNATGSFVFQSPNGTGVLLVTGPSGFGDGNATLFVTGAPVSGISVALQPLSLASAATDRFETVVVIPILAIIALAGAFAVAGARQRRLALGLPLPILSRFGRYVVMRLLLIVAQVTAMLVVLFVFGSFLPAAAENLNPSVLSGGATGSCSWSNFFCVVGAFGTGLGRFLVNMFTGNWGIVSFGNLNEPAVTYLIWWLPYSIELGVIALAISAVLAYGVGLRAGWKPSSVFDIGARLTSLIGLLLPTFLVILLLLTAFYTAFTTSVGDAPFGTIPTPAWFALHNGPPSWIGIGENTSPTGFPLIDGLVHGDWTFESITLAKTLLQAFVIAITYVAIFLRYARNVVVQAGSEAHVIAARARGVSESTLLWKHTGRRVLPLFILIAGLTIPVYIGTQAVVEVVFNDVGLGPLLLGEISQAANRGAVFGFGGSPTLAQVGNLYQVTIFFLLLAVLLGNLIADITARYLDPRLQREAV